MQGVKLINRNARLYDPKLHRFLQPDNYIQDPSNTQNYNRFGYCLNNPLKYTDPSGNFVIETAMLVSALVYGAIIGGAVYGIMAATGHAEFSFEGAFKSVVLGAVSGAVTCGIGEAVGTIGQFGTKIAVQAAAHGVFQGIMSVGQGGKFWSGFAAGAVSSLASSLWTGGKLDKGGEWGGIGGKYAESLPGMMLFGTVSGGAAASLSGGNFWQGAVTGLIVSALNHGLHEVGERQSFRNRFHNVDPDAKPDFSMSSVNAVMNDVDGLSNFYNSKDVGAPEIKLMPNDGDAGHYNKDTHQIQLTKNAFSNNYHLARTLFHESYHSFQYHWNGGYEYNSIIKKYGNAFYKDVRSGYETPSFKQFELRAYQFLQVLGDSSMYNEGEIYKRTH